MICSTETFQLQSELGVQIELQLGEYFEEDSTDYGPSNLESIGPVTCQDSSAWDELSIYRSWKDQARNRFGAGSPAPSIPRSQRLYEGENYDEFCEVWIG